MPPLLVGNALHVARREGLLPKLSEKEETTVAKMVPGPGSPRRPSSGSTCSDSHRYWSLHRRCQRRLCLIRRLAITTTPVLSPMTPPTMAAGMPTSMTANGAVGAWTMRPMTSPTTAPIMPAIAAPMIAHRPGSGRPPSPRRGGLHGPMLADPAKCGLA